jgi:hypothetical protein
MIMWVFTEDGFFSAVKDRYCKDGELVVRARVREDLIRFLNHMGLAGGEILVFHQADYRYRVIIPADHWANYLKDRAEGINYDNFKNRVFATWDPIGGDRHTAYHRVWLALYALQAAEYAASNAGELDEGEDAPVLAPGFR